MCSPPGSGVEAPHTHRRRRSTHSSKSACCRKAGPFQGPKPGSSLTLRNQLSEETHVLTKHKILLGKGAGGRAVGEGNPGELLCRVACNLRFYDDGISFRVVFGQSL